MSEVLDDLGAYIDASTALTLGTDLFLSVMPETPDACTAVIETVSPAPVDTFGASAIPTIEMPRAQVLTRHARPDIAKTTSRTVWAALGAIPEGVLGGGDKRWLRCELLQSPFLVGRDENDRTLVGFSIQVWKATA